MNKTYILTGLKFPLEIVNYGVAFKMMYMLYEDKFYL